MVDGGTDRVRPGHDYARSHASIAGRAGQVFKSNKSIRFEASNDLGEMPVPYALHETDDMVIVEPPCHPAQPVKVPDDAVGPYHCLVCGSLFSA